jgi:O-antigen ligase
MISAMILKARERAGKINQWLTALLAFALPLSTSAITVLALLILLLWVFEGRFAEKFVKIKSNPVALSVLGLLAVLVIGLTWSPDVPAGLEVIAARWKLALLPVFLTAVDTSSPRRYLYFFVAGVCVAMTMTYLAWFDILHYADVTSTHLTKKNSHVVYNPLLAFSLYLVLHEAIWGGYKRRKQIGLFILASVMTFNMFITEGRIGQLAFFILLIVLLFQFFSKNRMKAVLAVCIVVPTLFIGGYKLSPSFQNRIDNACMEVQQFKQNPDTSVGLRLLFWQNTIAIIKRHPVLGIGTGGFAIAYYWHNWELSPWHIATDNPHNQYLLVTATVGIPGITALFLIFVTMFVQAWKMDDRYQRIRFAFPLFFLTIMLTESYLKVYETAFLFSLFSAVLFAKTLQNNHESSIDSRLLDK